MLVRHATKKSLGNPSKSKTRLSAKPSTGEKIKKPLKSKHKKSVTRAIGPRTCLDSPIQFKSRRSSKKLTPCETHRVLPKHKPHKPVKSLFFKEKLLSKEKVLSKKGKSNSKPFEIEKILISPIKKIKLDFCNFEDNSMMKFLEII